jgi:hypothetical protein
VSRWHFGGPPKVEPGVPARSYWWELRRLRAQADALFGLTACLSLLTGYLASAEDWPPALASAALTFGAWLLAHRARRDYLAHKYDPDDVLVVQRPAGPA